MNRLKVIWGNIHSSLWFLPSAIVALFAIFAIGLIQADSSDMDDFLERWPRLFGAGAESARVMLGTIASSIMAVVSVTFSIIVVALTLASSQYSPRVLRNFMGSRVTQTVLGLFAGIFCYSLIVLRTIRGGDDNPFVPSLAVFFGFIFALLSVGVLIFFIHHIASSIQASNVIQSVQKETSAAIERLFPKKLGESIEPPGEAHDQAQSDAMDWQAIPALRNGYLQHVDNDGLLRLAKQHDVVIKMNCYIGDYIVEDTDFVHVAGAGIDDRGFAKALNNQFNINSYRTANQDPAFGIRQLVDVALKALSAGINDTTTAVTCIDFLTTILKQLAEREFPSPYRQHEGQLRVIAKSPSFEEMLCLAFDEIRWNARLNTTILLKQLQSLQTIGLAATSEDRVAAVRKQIDYIEQVRDQADISDYECRKIDQSIQNVRESLTAPRKELGEN